MLYYTSNIVRHVVTVYQSCQPLAIKRVRFKIQKKCVFKVEHKMLETIELIQTLCKFVLEISPKCWSLQPNSESLLYFLMQKLTHPL